MNIPFKPTDPSSSECKASGAFSASFAAGNAVDMRFHTELVFWLVVTNLGTNTQADLVVECSDDGSTIGFDAANRVKSDDNILNGVFTAKDYTAQITTADGTLKVGACGPFRFPKMSGSMRPLIKGTAADGAYSIRYQRISH